ncbi:MAG: S24 family peptidase [Pseudomonadota bacterium]
MLSWVSAGRLQEVSDLAATRNLEIIPIADLPGGEYFATVVRGDSMDRISPEGSRIIVNASDREPRPGRYYLFSHRGEATYKRYESEPVIRLEPFSTNPSNQTIYPKADKDWTVIGRVVRSYIDLG